METVRWDTYEQHKSSDYPAFTGPTVQQQSQTVNSKPRIKWKDISKEAKKSGISGSDL
jgi:hypothetical protein